MSLHWNFLGLTALVFIAIATRYLAFSALLHWAFWKKTPSRIFQQLSKVPPKKARIRQEIFWSLASSIVFAGVFTAVFLAFENGYTWIYEQPLQYGLVYLLISGPLVLFLQDLHFYLFHRLLHHPRFYRFHKIHHISREPSAWTAFCFHPVEALLSASFLPLVAFFVPLHISLVGILFVVMTLLAVTNHLGWEIWPKTWLDRWPLSWLISARHHQNHHSKFNGNYGLYFRFWDRVAGTDVGLFRSRQ